MKCFMSTYNICYEAAKILKFDKKTQIIKPSKRRGRIHELRLGGVGVGYMDLLGVA